MKTLGTIKIVNIVWVTDGEELDLPTTFEVPNNLDEFEIADYLSDEVGFLVESWEYDNWECDKTLTNANLTEVVGICEDYINSCENEEEKEKYQQELDACKTDLSLLADTGIFHDAVGKVLEKNYDTIKYTIDY
jgi:hypothetical protein